VGVAGALEGGVEEGAVFFRLRGVEEHRREVAAATEPAFCGDQHAGVHVDGGHVGVLQVGHQADAGGEEARVFGRAGDLGAEFRAELAFHGGDVHADLLENAAVHEADDAAAAMGAVFGGAAPGTALEASGGLLRHRVWWRFGLDCLEGGADSVAQRLEPGAGLGFEGLVG